MSDVGSLLNDIFNPLGAIGGLLCIFLLFYIDAIVLPTLPELFTVLIYTTDYGVDHFLFGVVLLITIMVAEVAGLVTLYTIVKRAKVPGWIHRAVLKYQGFLLCHDERMILVNRVAPVLPFLGAFTALCNWSLRKAIVYILIGGGVKYGLILALSGVFITYMERGTATVVTLVMVFIVIGLSTAATLLRKRKIEGSDANRTA